MTNYLGHYKAWLLQEMARYVLGGEQSPLITPGVCGQSQADEDTAIVVAMLRRVLKW